MKSFLELTFLGGDPVYVNHVNYLTYGWKSQDELMKFWNKMIIVWTAGLIDKLFDFPAVVRFWLLLLSSYFSSFINIYRARYDLWM